MCLLVWTTHAATDAAVILSDAGQLGTLGSFRPRSKKGLATMEKQ